MDVPESYMRPKPVVQEADFWFDPDPDSKGLLLSDRILFYCDRVCLIHPYDERFVEPASYTLHAGQEYIIAQKSGEYQVRSLKLEGKVIIPPNGLIYIRFFEEVNIPHYMIARFNLRVTQVYRGLLLGTGPQVDPGFRGRLGCPIHNFTDAEKAIHFFDPLATIDFEKTTPLGEKSLTSKRPSDLRTEDFTAMRSGSIPVFGHHGFPCRIFNKRLSAEFSSYLPAGESVRSSVQALYDDVKRLKKELASLRRAGITGLIVALVSLLAGALFSLYPLYTNIKDDIANRYMDVKRDVVEINRAIAQLEVTQKLKEGTADRTGKSSREVGKRGLGQK